MIPLTVPQIDEREIQAVSEVLRSGMLVQGPHVEEFERLVVEYTGAKYAVAVSSGTAALHLSLLVLGIGPGDEVIVPDFTYPATGNVVRLVGAVPVLVDIDLETFNLDPALLESAVTERTKAIMPVHAFGCPADMDPILEVANRHNLRVVEDAACALGATYQGRQCGTMGDLGCFSFHPRKSITTGEGGMVITSDAELAERVRRLRNHGAEVTDGKWRFLEAGYNYRMTDIQGALGCIQMGKLAQILDDRRACAGQLTQRVESIDAVRPPVEPGESRHVYQSYVMLLGCDVDRDSVIQWLRERGCGATIGTYALHGEPAFLAWRHRSAPQSLSAEAHRRALTLPLFPGMTDDVMQQVVSYLGEAITHGTS